MSDKSTSEQDKINTTAHLTQTIGVHLSHVDRHLRALKKSITPAQKDFNFEHVEKHAGHAMSHQQKLMDHLKANYPKEYAEIKKLEDTIPRTDHKSIALKG